MPRHASHLLLLLTLALASLVFHADALRYTASLGPASNVLITAFPNPHTVTLEASTPPNATAALFYVKIEPLFAATTARLTFASANPITSTVIVVRVH